jgi:hypothetical protein
MHDLHNPRYNLRSLVKELLLLEDHLACQEKQCRECILKHALKAEGLAEEGLMLGADESLTVALTQLLDALYVVTDHAMQGSWAELGPTVRVIRRDVQRLLMV